MIVAKHGNRTNTRASGSAEAMAALGVDIEAPIAVVEACLEKVGLGFLYAVKMHPAMKHAAPVRRLLGIKSIFNVIGPLTNPAGARRQVLGVARLDMVEKIAAALHQLDTKHALVVHGGGLCDMTVTGPSRVIEVRPEGLRELQVTPGEVGLKVSELKDLLVDSPARSAETIQGILGGKCGACRDIAVLNAGAAILVGGKAGSLAEGVRAAEKSIDSGAARGSWRRSCGRAGRRGAGNGLRVTGKGPGFGVQSTACHEQRRESPARITAGGGCATDSAGLPPP